MTKIKDITVLRKHTDLIESLAFVKQKNSLLSASRDGYVFCWDTRTHEVVGTWCPYDGIEINHADVSGDLRFALACFSQYKEMRILDKDTNSVSFIPLLGYLGFPSFSIDNSIVAFTKNKIYKISITEHKGIKTIFRTDSKILSMALVNSKSDILCNTKHWVYIVDAVLGRQIAKIPKCYAKISLVSYLEEKSFVIIVDSRLNCIDIWHFKQGENHSSCSHIVSYPFVQTWCNSLSEFWLGKLLFINEYSAIACGITIPITFIDFSKKEAHFFDPDIGYVETMVFDTENNSLYVPYAKERGSLGIISFTQ